MSGPAHPFAQEVAIPATGLPGGLPGRLEVPWPVCGCVIFAHGSGSNRMSPRNRSVAAGLQRAGFATLVFDLLTPDEASTRANVFDTPLLADRLTGALDWVRSRPDLADLPVGLFGSSTGAAAALMTAARRPAQVGAVVSRGGRPDLAAGSLSLVRCPVLLIVGGADPEVLVHNRAAQRQLRGRSVLSVVPGATHLFAEPGALEEVARLARDWFGACLVTAPGGSRAPDDRVGYPE